MTDDAPRQRRCAWRRSWAWRVFLALIAALASQPHPARAHPIVSTDINRHVVITVRPQRVEVDYLYEMLEIAALAAAREADLDGDGRTSEAEHEAQFRRWANELAGSLQLELDGVPLPLSLADRQRSRSASVYGLSTTIWNLRFLAPLPAHGAQGSLVFRDRYRQDLAGWKEIVVLGEGVGVGGAGPSAQDRSQRLTDYSAMSELPNPDEQGVTVMLAGAPQVAASSAPAAPVAPRPARQLKPQPETHVPEVPAQRAATAAVGSDHVRQPGADAPPEAPRTRGWRVRLLQDAWPFFRFGTQHIATGYDHLLFLLGLLLFRLSLARVVAVVSAFTVAHSLTLALAALGWLTPPGATIELLIALTIAYVGAASLVRPESRHGPWLAFGFGLVHGFGFAGALNAALEARMDGHWLLSLASFNLGIEAFQLLAVCAIYPLLRSVDGFAWAGSLRRVLSFAVLSAGLGWLAARAAAL